MTPKRVHFIAIGGTGMGSLAGLLKARGIEVTGSDKKLYPPMSDALAKWGIAVHEGFRPENLVGANGEKPELVIIGNAVRADNPEARAAIDGGYRYLSFPDALYELAIRGKHSIVVSGTHGKTTVTSLIATLLLETGQDPSLLVGGIAANFDGSFREGKGPHFVVEGDEYDTAFFDKTPKFLHYHPHSLVITSVEFDHADIYRDLEHVKEMFRRLVAAMPKDGVIVAALDHAGVRDVVADAPCRVVGYDLAAASASATPSPDAQTSPDARATDATEPSARTQRQTVSNDQAASKPALPKKEKAFWRAKETGVDAEGTSFTLFCDDEECGVLKMPLFGAHNLENVLAALVVLCMQGVSLEAAAAALLRYRGVKRRQEARGEVGGVLVIDDFAHHPTAVRVTLDSILKRLPTRRLVAVFEPRTNTSRRKVFQEAYAQAFDAAARVLLSIVPDEPIYSATGEVTELFSAPQLASDLNARGISATALPGPDAIVAQLLTELQPGDVVLIMSNGAFGNIWQKLLDALKAREAR